MKRLTILPPPLIVLLLIFLSPIWVARGFGMPLLKGLVASFNPLLKFYV